MKSDEIVEIETGPSGEWLCPDCGGELARTTGSRTLAMPLTSFDSEGRVVYRDPNVATMGAFCWKDHYWVVRSSSDGVVGERR